MTRRDELTAILAGEPTQGLSSIFWKHFAPAERAGDEAYAAHVRWIAATDPVLVKVMNEALYPHGQEFADSRDWASVKAYPTDHLAMRAQRDLVSRMVDSYSPTHHVLVTMHGVTASAFHARGGSDDYDQKRTQLTAALREDPALVEEKFALIGESLVAQAKEFMRAGADGVFLAALGGEAGNFTDEEFDRVVRPHDIAILEAVGEAGGLRYLHICKEDVALDRYAGYPADIVQVGEHVNGLDLGSLRALFPQAVIVGGVDNADPYFVDGGSADSLAREVRQAVADHTRLIVGADCSLPDATDPDLVGALSRVLRSLDT